MSDHDEKVRRCAEEYFTKYAKVVPPSAKVSEVDDLAAHIARHFPAPPSIEGRMSGGQRANLSGAYLRGAFRIIRLPVGDPRGYDCVAIWNYGWTIVAGCHRFAVDDARAHWGDGYDGDRDTGDRYLYALDWLAANEGRLLATWGDALATAKATD